MEKTKITGKLTDGNEPLLYANVYISDEVGQLIPGAGATTTDENGKYTLVGTGNFITFASVGYKPKTMKTEDLVANPNVDMADSSNTTLQEVVVSATRPENTKPQAKKPLLPKWAVLAGGAIVIGGLLYLALRKGKNKLHDKIG